LVKPPSTVTLVPVLDAASGPARKATAPAMSAGATYERDADADAVTGRAVSGAERLVDLINRLDRR
jgi:hypothetical protein